MPLPAFIPMGFPTPGILIVHVGANVALNLVIAISDVLLPTTVPAKKLVDVALVHFRNAFGAELRTTEMIFPTGEALIKTPS